MYNSTRCEKTSRITKLIDDLYKKMPVIESARAKLLAESYSLTENEPIIIRRAKAFEHILKNIPIIIREGELIVGSTTIAPRGCQTYPEFSYEWLESEFETVEKRSADPFYIANDTKKDLLQANKYFKGKTTSELATAYMAPEAIKAIEHNVFTPGNYFYNGVGHVTVHYDWILAVGFEGLKQKIKNELSTISVGDSNYAKKSHLLEAMLISIDAVIAYANRYSVLAKETADKCTDKKRKEELLTISENCKQVPEKGAKTFWQACQTFWFIQQLLQVESSGHSISPGRFDQYMYPYFKHDTDKNGLSRDFAQELIDCIFVKFNDLNKCRDASSAEGFAGYSLFQNLIVGGQNEFGRDVTNDLSFMCLDASMHTHLPQPSLSIRVWNGSPNELLLRAAEVTRTGVGLPAYYNDEVIIPSLMSMGLTIEEARNYNIIGCVEPQIAGKTEGWHDAAFFNMCRPLEFVFSNGMDGGEQVSIQTGEISSLTTFEKFFNAYEKQMEYNISLLVNADNAIDVAHAERCPLPFLSSMIEDCIGSGKTVQEGGAIHNFTGPQGFGIANMVDSLYAIKTLVYENHAVTLEEYKEALDNNFGMGIDETQAKIIAQKVILDIKKQGRNPSEWEIQNAVRNAQKDNLSKEKKEKYQNLLKMINALPKYGNDIDEVDELGRLAEYTYAKPLKKYLNPRGGKFQAGLYPVSANVPLGAQTGATPDGRLAHKPIADGVSPSAGKDTHGPTAAANSVAKLDHGICSNGTLYNQKFHPSALAGQDGLIKFVALIRSYFDQKGSHVQFNVVDKQTLLDAQKHPEEYKHLVVRVAGYSALFTTLSKSLQDDIISRTEQGF